MRSLLLRAVVVVVAAVPAACGRSAPTAPPPSGEAASVPVSRQPILIVDGIDGRGIGFATAMIDRELFVTDASGRIDFPANSYTEADTGAPLAIDVPGYLPRRTVVPPSRRITLWPVAGGEDGEEAAAVREMVYGPGGSLHEPRTHTSIVLIFSASPEVRDAWMDEARAFGAPLGLTYESYPYEPYDPYGGVSENQLRVRFDTRPRDCVSDESPGYCRASSDGRTFSVAAGRARDARTIRRVLAAWFLHPNPLPGLMNDDVPAGELSPLESRTIRMILQRPQLSRWPDDDYGR